MVIVNLTQHAATPLQRAAGVIDFSDAEKATLVELLTINCKDDAEPDAMVWRAKAIADIASNADAEQAMIGGHLGLTALVARELAVRGIAPLLAFSERLSTDEVQPDGSVIKRPVFIHTGFTSFPT